MIETKEDYEVLIRVSEAYPSLELGGIIETIEALRAVARAAKHLAARGYAEPNRSWQKNTLDRLDALPDWLTEDVKTLSAVVANEDN